MILDPISSLGSSQSSCQNFQNHHKIFKILYIGTYSKIGNILKQHSLIYVLFTLSWRHNNKISCMGSIGSSGDDERDRIRQAISSGLIEILMMQGELQEYVLDLSISLKTGKETNMDFCSRGD